MAEAEPRKNWPEAVMNASIKTDHSPHRSCARKRLC
jgi:hypothetical protein